MYQKNTFLAEILFLEHTLWEEIILTEVRLVRSPIIDVALALWNIWQRWQWLKPGSFFQFWVSKQWLIILLWQSLLNLSILRVSDLKKNQSKSWICFYHKWNMQIFAVANCSGNHFLSRFITFLSVINFNRTTSIDDICWSDSRSLGYIWRREGRGGVLLCNLSVTIKHLCSHVQFLLDTGSAARIDWDGDQFSPHC